MLAQQAPVSAIYNEDGQVGHYVAVYVDVTEQVRREKAVLHQAQHDPLTGLPNRNLLLDRMIHAIEVAKRDGTAFSILFIELDGFKPINDEFGHKAGDLLLKEIARRLLTRCRESDTMARYGGDEFIVLPRNTGGVDAVGAVAEQLIECIAMPVTMR